MIGPTVGALLLRDYYHAVGIALILTCIATVFLFYLPIPILTKSQSEKRALEKTDTGEKSGIKSAGKPVKKSGGLAGLLSSLHMPIAQTKGAKLLFFMRLNMALAFSIFMTIWTVSLKQRFAFAAADHAYFMGM